MVVCVVVLDLGFVATSVGPPVRLLHTLQCPPHYMFSPLSGFLYEPKLKNCGLSDPT